jgi:hypothetical protein
VSFLHRLTPGTIVASRPHTDAWMMGDRYGAVEKVGYKWLHVRMDRSGRVRKFAIHRPEDQGPSVPGVRLFPTDRAWP